LPFRAFSGFNTLHAAAQSDTSLSPDGRRAKSAKVAADAFGALAAVETSTVKVLAGRAKALEDSLLARMTPVPPRDQADRLAYELRLIEVRDQLRVLSAAERANVYRTSSDPITLAAIDTAPPTLSQARPDGSKRLEPFIDAAERTAAILARAERSDPATTKQLRELQQLGEVYRLAINGVRKEIADETPVAVGE
jgi:hypothetical protein